MDEGHRLRTGPPVRRKSDHLHRRLRPHVRDRPERSDPLQRRPRQRGRSRYPWHAGTGGAYVTDINAPAAFSDELVGAEWEPPTAAAALGATFIGHNAARGYEWDTRCFVDAYDEARVFGWRTSDPDHPGARWRFELEPIAGATRLRFLASLGPGPSGTSKAIERHPDHEARIIERRLAQIHFNLANVVAGIKAAAETTDRSV